MKKTVLLALMLLLGVGARAEKVALSTPRNTLVLDLWKGGEPKFVYYGKKLSASDLAVLPDPTNANWSHLEVYPAYGATHTQSETAFAMRHVLPDAGARCRPFSERVSRVMRSDAWKRKL